MRITFSFFFLIVWLPQVFADRFYDTLICEDFSNPARFASFIPEGETPGKAVFSGGLLELTADYPSEYAGVYCLQEVSGNFFAETRFESDNAVGLMLIAVKHGKPDYDNYTLLTVNTREGTVVVNQYDRQRGVGNVHDPKGQINPGRYEARLDGCTFSLPFTSTGKTIRILHESLSNTFHFYYGVQLDKWGLTSNDWLEVAPQYSWLGTEQQYFVGLVCHPADSAGSTTVRYKSLTVVKTPVDDIDDSHSGFRARKRSFSWSGFDGEATVVSFGDAFEHNRNIKFVIWDRANNAPVWRLSNQFLLNFEFFECGDSVHPGCHEAMSDRQRHGQSVTIIEDNDVRKILHWHGIPLNPDYHYSGEHQGGEELPYYDEYWTFYPDGTGTRRLIDRPKLDVPHRRQWGPEVLEPMPIGGSLVEAGDLCNTPALSVFNLTDPVKTYFPPPAQNEYAKDSWKWPQVIFDCHFKNGLPDFYMVYNQSAAYPETWPGLPLETQISWHHTNYNFSHWPVGREPYGQNTNGWGAESRSYASHPNEVTHTSLASAGFYDTGLDYGDHFSIDSAGRKYREHVMLIGVSKPYDYNSVRDNVQTWLDPGIITMLDKNASFVRNDRLTRCLVFDNTLRNSRCHFSIQPGERPLVNPAIQILNWTGGSDVAVKINGTAIPCKVAIEGHGLLVWIKTTITEESDISIAEL